MNTYRINWGIYGSATVEAESEDEAIMNAILELDDCGQHLEFDNMSVDDVEAEIG